MSLKKPSLQEQIKFLTETRKMICKPNTEVILDFEVYPLLTEILETLRAVRLLNQTCEGEMEVSHG